MTGNRSVLVLGSTGSVGTQALELIAEQPGAVHGGTGWPRAARDIAAARARRSGEHDVRRVAVADRDAADDPAPELPGTGRRVEVLAGPEAAAELTATATADTVLNGITGSVGPRPDARRAGQRRHARAGQQGVAGRGRRAGDRRPRRRADRAGRLRALRAGAVPARRPGRRGRPAGAHRVRRPVPRAAARRSCPSVTVEQALAHPTWDMGPVVTINSATLVNKGLELIEAHLLFGVPYDRIDVVVHPQSVIHSMVTFVDGSTLAQASPPDMRLPIALALAWPERLPGPRRRAAGTRRRAGRSSRSTTTRSPASALARAAGDGGGCVPAVLNAANEEAVGGVRRAATLPVHRHHRGRSSVCSTPPTDGRARSRYRGRRACRGGVGARARAREPRRPTRSRPDD